MSVRALAVGPDKSSVEKGFRSGALLAVDGAGSAMICEFEREVSRKWRKDRKKPTGPFLDHSHCPASELMAPPTVPIAQGLSGRLA